MKTIKTACAFICGLVLLTAVAFAADNSTVPAISSKVYTGAGNTVLLVEKAQKTDGKDSLESSEPFIIKGVNWSPATRAPQYAKGVPPILGSSYNLYDFAPEKTRYYGYFDDSQYDTKALGKTAGKEVMRFWLRNEIFEEYERDLKLIKEMNANTIRITANVDSALNVYNTFAKEMNRVLDECYKNKLMVIMTVVLDIEKGITAPKQQRYLDIVKAHKNHPAILMWAIGDEWNSQIQQQQEFKEKAEIVNTIAAQIRSEDKNHPVCSILRYNKNHFTDATMCFGAVAGCASVDLWGVNIYAQTSNEMRQCFDKLGKLRHYYNKVVFISGFGIDSFEGEKKENQKNQADIDAELWGCIQQYIECGNIIGGLLYEFNDAVWKIGNAYFDNTVEEPLNSDWKSKNPYGYKTYNDEEFTVKGTENKLNVEHCGVVDADRTPKQAYNRMKDIWSDPDITQEIKNNDFTPPIISNVKCIPKYDTETEKLKIEVYFTAEDYESKIEKYIYKIKKKEKGNDSIAQQLYYPEKQYKGCSGFKFELTKQQLMLLSKDKKCFITIDVSNSRFLWSRYTIVIYLSFLETPWKTKSIETAQGFKQNITIDFPILGYRFVTNSNGTITRLGGRFSGKHPVYLWDDSRKVLAMVEVNSTKDKWTYVSIRGRPIQIFPNRLYTVGVYLEKCADGTGWMNPTGSGFSLSASGGNIEIIGSRMGDMTTAAGYPIFPDNNMYGMVDVEYLKMSPEETFDYKPNKKLELYYSLPISLEDMAEAQKTP